MDLLSNRLVSEAYRKQLQQDLDRATVCRFLVAYITSAGVHSIGRARLVRALRDPRSFGVGSLSCTCGYDALLDLQAELDEPRLKYFMDPLVKDEDSEDIVLFHSKLVFLFFESEARAVVYVGSHNWTERALGPGSPRNADASFRVEVPAEPGTLDGLGTSLASDVNKHLLQAYNLPACLPANEAHRATFEQWFQKGCRRAPSTHLDAVTVVLAVHRSGRGTVPPAQWQSLLGRGIYFQALGEEEGQLLWHSGGRILLLVWHSDSDLEVGNQPLLLRCRPTTNNAGPHSALHGTNRSAAPIAGFDAVVFDPSQFAAAQESRTGWPKTISNWAHHAVEVFDFEFPTDRTESSEVDGSVEPRYQFYLEVEAVIFPADGACPDAADMVWTRETFAVAQDRRKIRYEEVPGYLVPPRQAEEIRQCLAEVLHVEPEQAKVLPVSEYSQPKLGKKTTTHPLHETFIGPSSRERRDEFYRASESGLLLADLDPREDSQWQARLFAELPEPESIQRVQHVFTARLKDLEKLWRGTAARYRR